MNEEFHQLPLVSIVCTTYNHEKYIREALDGFLIQQTTFPIEIIVHDDASTDNTVSILKQYEKNYPHLFRNIYQIENQYSKNVDIWSYLFTYKCRGKYIAICEGDDYWTDFLKLQKQIDFLENHSNYSMCFHNALKLYNETGVIKKFNKTSLKSRDLSLRDVVHNWLVPTASIVGRTEFMRYNPDWLCRIYSGDYSLILKLHIQGSIYYINEIMSVYRISQTGSSMTALMKGKNFFILRQKILLLESLNAGTNYKYSIEIDKEIIRLKKELLFQKAKSSRSYFKMIKMPLFIIEKLLKKLFF
jgi:glycosyltransferase involved in cell wall biosynthesis